MMQTVDGAVRTGTTDGSAYMGTYGRDSGGSNIGLYNVDDDVLNTNPYFWSGDFTSLDTWYMIVGHIFPDGWAGSDEHEDSGIYTVDGYDKATTRDFYWHTDNAKSTQRSYFYYCVTITNRQYMAYPRYNLCDGSEPSILEMLNGIDSRNHDYIKGLDGDYSNVGVDKYGIWHTHSISEIGPAYGLTNYWKLNREFRDWAGGATSTFTGTEIYVSGILGEALSNDGTANYIALDNTITMSDEFSVSFVANRTDTSAYHFVIGTTTGAGSKPKIGFTTGTQYLFVRVVDAGSSDSTTAPVTTATDTHVVVTRDSDNVVTAYINGTSYALFSSAAQSGDFTIDNIGTDESTQEMSGWYDEVRVYDRTLTQAEVSQLYNIYINEAPMQFDGVGRTLLRGKLITT